MDVSIIIVNWNTRDILRDCLRSVYEQTRDISFEVIVIDNASNDGSAEMVKREFPQVRPIENTENRGFAAANNQGMKIAGGQYVLLLNPDTIVLDRAIEKTVTFADLRPDVGILSCSVLNEDGSFQDTCFTFPSITNFVLSALGLPKLWPTNRFFGRVRMSWFDWKHEQDVDVVVGCFMLVRRAAIDRVGLMDEGYFMYAEETDWCYRFQKAGWRIVYAPVGKICHLGGRSTKLLPERMFLQLQGSILQFIHKHRSKPVYILSCLLTSLHFALRLPVLGWACLRCPSDTALKSKCRMYARATVWALWGWQRLSVGRRK